MRDRSEWIAKLIGSRKSRESYIRSKLNVLLPSQIRGLRRRRELKQEELGREADMKQSRISAMERPGETQFNIETLIRLAAALRVGLKVEFVPFSDMLRWENEFSQDQLDIVPIDQDMDFLHPEAAAQNTIQELAKVIGAPAAGMPPNFDVPISASGAQVPIASSVPHVPPKGEILSVLGTSSDVEGFLPDELRRASLRARMNLHGAVKAETPNRPETPDKDRTRFAQRLLERKRKLSKRPFFGKGYRRKYA